MKKLLLMAVAAFTVSTGAFAQIQRKSDTTRQFKTEKRQDRMAQLNLTQEQKEKIKQMRQQDKTKFDAVKNDNSLTQEQKKAKMMELRKSSKEGMNSILTKDQQEKMKAYKKDHPNKHGKKWNGEKMKEKKRMQKTQAPVKS